MTNPETLSETDLHAYVDGELDADRTADVEAWLSTHPDDAARVHAYRLQNHQLNTLYGDLIDAPVPPAITAAVRQHRRPAGLPPWARLAASIVLVLIGGLGGWGVSGWQSPSSTPTVSGQTSGKVPSGQASFVEQALDAHAVFVSGDGGVRETPIGAGRQPYANYARHLGHALKVPDLVGAGFKLTGGRVLTNKGARAAQFMYKDAAGRMVTLFVQSGFDREDMTFRLVAENSMVAFYWTDGPLGYALTGSMKRGDLLDLARMVYEKLRG